MLMKLLPVPARLPCTHSFRVRRLQLVSFATAFSWQSGRCYRSLPKPELNQAIALTQAGRPAEAGVL